MRRRRYENLNPEARTATFLELLRWRKERSKKRKDMSFRIGQASEKRVAYLQRNQQDFTITWIGHSTFLIQFQGVTIITDPVFAQRMGLDRRLEEPGLQLQELPPIDVVLLSHSHYDHLDVRSLRGLTGNPHVLVPEGLGKMVGKIMKSSTVHEVQWGKHIHLGPLSFHAVPAQHWTRRTLSDTNTSHWCGWVICPLAEEAKQFGSIYFAGDSGYFSGFTQIGREFPSITYALLPIGAYEPEWFMSTQHMTPEEAVQAFGDVKARVFIPMHYGSFYLADDTTDEALGRLLAEWDRRNYEKNRLQLFKHGETVIVTDEEAFKKSSN